MEKIKEPGNVLIFCGVCITIAALFLILTSCGSSTETGNVSTSGSNALGESGNSEQEYPQELSSAEKQQKAEEYAEYFVTRVFTDMYSEAEIPVFLPNYSYHIDGNDVTVEAIANLPIPVPKGAWDAGMTMEMENNPIKGADEKFARFHDMLEEQMNSFVVYAVPDYTEHFDVVLVVTNPEGEILSEYR